MLGKSCLVFPLGELDCFLACCRLDLSYGLCGFVSNNPGQFRAGRRLGSLCLVDLRGTQRTGSLPWFWSFPHARKGLKGNFWKRKPHVIPRSRYCGLGYGSRSNEGAAAPLVYSQPPWKGKCCCAQDRLFAGMGLTSHGASCPNWTQPLVKVDLFHDTFLSSKCHLTLGMLGIAGDTTSAIPAFYQQ